MKAQKSVTLIELIIGISLMALVVLNVSTIHTAFTQMTLKSIYRALLYQDTNFALERMLKEVKRGSYLATAPNSLTITTEDYSTGNKTTSQYYLASQELRYRPNTSYPNTFEVIQKNVQAFTLTAKQPQLGTNRYQGAQIALQAKDPQNRIDTISFLQSIAFCRVPYSALVRLVSADRTTVKGLYDTIQEAINAAAASSDDVIQVSSNQRIPYQGAVVVYQKSLVLEGGYDNKTWQRHPLPTGEVEPNYETTIQGIYNQPSHFPTTNPCLIALVDCRRITLDGFTLIGGIGPTSVAHGIGVSSSLIIESLAIRNNNFSQLPRSIAFYDFTFTYNNTNITIENNKSSNVVYGMVMGRFPLTGTSSVNIQNNTFTDGNGISIENYSNPPPSPPNNYGTIPNLNILNNTIQYTSAPSGGMGIGLDAGTYTNLNIEGNTFINLGAAGRGIDLAGPHFTNAEISNNTFIGPINYGINIRTNFSYTIQGNQLKVKNNFLKNIQTGIYCLGVSLISNLQLKNNIIVDGDVGLYYVSDGAIQINNNTLFNNNYDLDIVMNTGSTIAVQNCIFQHQTNLIKTLSGTPTVNISYSDINGGCPVMSGVNCGTGNIDANPLFADSTNGDYHLQDTSPCKDTGNQASQYNDPEDPNPPSGRALDPPSKGTVRNDMGAYGGPDAGIVGATAP